MPVKPRTVLRSEWDKNLIEYSYLEISPGKDRAEAVTDLVYGLRLSKCLVLTKNINEAREICTSLRKAGVDAESRLGVWQEKWLPFDNETVYCSPINERPDYAFRNLILTHVPVSCDHYEKLLKDFPYRSASAGRSFVNLFKASASIETEAEVFNH